MDVLACPESISNKGSCIDYYFRLYNNVRVTFSDQTLGYVNIIKNYTHPFLKLVSLYLVENYRRASEYFSKNGDNTQNVACEVLNRWLDQKKNFFTFSEKCNSSVIAWNAQVEGLWKTIQHNFGANHCNRVNKFSNTTVIPQDMLPATCYRSVPEEWECMTKTQYDKLLNSKKCSCSETSSDKTCISLTDLSNTVPQVQKSVQCEAGPLIIRTVALTGICTFWGTLVLLLFLYKFTPLVSWMYNRKFKKRMRIRYNTEDDAYDTFARDPVNMDANFENRRSYISYHSG